MIFVLTEMLVLLPTGYPKTGLVFNLVGFLFFTFFLFLPNANEYFTSTAVEPVLDEDDAPESELNWLEGIRFRDSDPNR